jgi:hypothetical protein
VGVRKRARAAYGRARPFEVAMTLFLLFACVATEVPAEDSAEDSAEAGVEEPDWAVLLDGAWDGRETSASMGTQRGEYVVSSTDGERFDVSYAPNGEVDFLKVYFTGVRADLSDSGVGYVRLPDQVYAEGQTGPATLALAGAGAYPVDGEEDAFDGRIDLDNAEVVLEATVTAFGSTENLTFRLTRAR